MDTITKMEEENGRRKWTQIRLNTAPVQLFPQLLGFFTSFAIACRSKYRYHQNLYLPYRHRV
ncbi:hypothetical protein [Nostoc sphaeroides]|uniref:Uncharacterized protein n=1 Tax=Nostoc sphaeroides CCNUC1 TaxID=2653204 RepID=A0A5P8W9Z2_9NOSO|nr:hypothetical protein [Nostoc sphaeroides]QFS49605.1 hypothetical protein GXM_07099 [Nostoc sphaeroides CCNUC1]